MDLETDPIVGSTIHIIVTEAEKTIRITVTTVVESTDLGIAVMQTIRETIGIMVGLVTEGITSSKIMVKDIETEV